MFHEITDKELQARRRKRIIAAVVVVALIAVIGGGLFLVRRAQREQGAQALHDTILDSAKQCCAIEGSYPKSLKHLEEDYGLTINHNDYIVSYEYFAGNIMPSVVVTPR